MPAISNYYAQVGVLLDDNSIRKVQAYLSSIERHFNAFQKRLEAKAPISVRVKIDRTRSAMQLQRDFAALGRLSHIQVNNVRFNRLAVQKNLQQVLQMAPGQSRIRVGALLSQSSLQAMQQQIRTSINAVVVSPRINPIVNQGVTRGGRGVFASIVGGGRGGRRGENPNGLSRDIRKVDPFGRADRRHFSPWYNPLMLGGSLGAFQRFGLFSLPLVAGSFGINAITNRAEALQNVPLQLAANTGSRQEGQQAFNFLTNLGGQLGFRVQDTAAAYGRMVSNSRGTGLDPQRAFTNFMQFSAVSGLAGEEQKRGLIAIEQMISARQVRQQEINQLNNAGLGVVTEILAESVAGGDVGKLRDMMKRGEVGVDAIQKMLDAMGERARPFLADFYKTIGRNRRVAQNATEQWFESFMSGNVTEAIANFYKTWAQSFRDGLGFAQRLGFAFAAATNYAEAAFLTVKETIDWLQGDAGEGNFLLALFGTSDDNQFIVDITNLFQTMSRVGVNSINEISKAAKDSAGVFGGLLDVLNGILEGLNRVLRLAASYQESGIRGITHELRRQQVEHDVRKAVNNEANKQEAATGQKIPLSDRNSVVNETMDEWDAINPAPLSSTAQLARRGLVNRAAWAGITDSDAATAEDMREWINRNIFNPLGFDGLPQNATVYGAPDKRPITVSIGGVTKPLSDAVNDAMSSPNSPFVWNSAQAPSSMSMPLGFLPAPQQSGATNSVTLPGLSDSIDQIISSLTRSLPPVSGDLPQSSPQQSTSVVIRQPVQDTLNVFVSGTVHHDGEVVDTSQMMSSVDDAVVEDISRRLGLTNVPYATFGQ